MKFKINVLVIDDDEIVRDVFLRIFQKRPNVELFVAENGYQGLEIIKRRRFNTIFLDLGMSGLNGVETFQRIQELDLNVKVTFMTASSNLSLEERAKRIPNVRVVDKPLEIEQIYKIIEIDSQYSGHMN